MSEITTLYRYKEKTHSSYDSERDTYGFSYTSIVCEDYKVVKYTPKGYWISWNTFFDTEPTKWVSKTSKKRFAHPTKKEAIDAFIYRKKYQIKMINFYLEKAEDFLRLGESEKEKLS